MTFIWFLIWWIFGDHFDPVVFAGPDGANGWAITLILALAIDVGYTGVHA